jgi:hypothetical protein
VTTTYAIASGPIAFYDSTSGKQIVVPLSAITFSGGTPILSSATFPQQPAALTDWIAYLASVGVIAPGAQDPYVTGISPSAGPLVGGTTVTITGSGLTGTTGVTFGRTAGAGVTVVSDTQVTVTLPANAAGPVAVVVTVGTGTTAATWTSPGTPFTYAPVPSVSSVSPATGPVGGGTPLTITGKGLTGATSVNFVSASISGAGAPGTNLTVYSDTQVTVTSPQGTAGQVTVTVTTPGGTSTGGPEFTYK